MKHSIFKTQREHACDTFCKHKTSMSIWKRRSAWRRPLSKWQLSTNQTDNARIT